MNSKFQCEVCGRILDRNPRLKNQRYCKDSPCQRVRKRLWQRQKLASDPDYKQNQRDSQHLWCSQNRHYWSDYRRRCTDYTERNRTLQKVRDTRRQQLKSDLAKMDASRLVFPVKQGTYYLIPEGFDLAKMDTSAQKFRLISVS